MSSAGTKRSRDGSVPDGADQKEAHESAPVTMKRRRRRWDAKPAAPPAPVVASASVSNLQDAAFKAQQADKIRATIAATLARINLPKIPTSQPSQPALGPGFGLASFGGMSALAASAIKPKGFSGVAGRPAVKKWRALKLDEKGREIDEQGNVIKSVRETTATLKVNQKRLLIEQQKFQPPPAKGPKSVKHLDPRISVAEKRSVMRRQKALSFIKQGKFQRKAQALRMEQISQQLRKDNTIVGKTGEGIQILPSRPIHVDELPDIEWWDEKVLGNNSSYEDFKADVVPPTVSLKVHHPVALAPPCEEEPPAPRPLMLTKKERKKIRRMNKLDKERERQDLVSAGLAAPKEPRLKLSNMMAILMDEAISDPSAVEKKVREQMARRAQAHLEHNASRKLSKQQKREKMRKKLKEDTTVKSFVTIFSTPDLSSKQIRFKIDANANQYNMTGIGIISDVCNVVVLEGGPKGTKKMKGILLRRIKWKNAEEPSGANDEGEEDDDEDEYDEEEAGTKQKAKMIWEGVQNQRKFLNFRFETCRSEAAARQVFAEKGLEHYWDQCLNEKINRES